MNTYYSLLNKMTAKPGKRDEIIAILLESGKSFNDNSSCVLYLVYKDVKDPDTIWVEDVWTNQSDHSAALNALEMQPYIMKCIPLLEGMPEQLEIDFAGGKGLDS
jgi:quinol monooxygenase YgiN